jgi:hypothetical protein
MATLLINYADTGFYEAQKRNTTSGLLLGGLNRAIQFGRSHINEEFLTRHAQTFAAKRGAGYWLWKPYIVLFALHRAMEDGDVLFYCDSGSVILEKITPLLELCQNRPDKPVLLFSHPPHYTNAVFTKRDCFHYMELDRPPYIDANHLVGGYFLAQKTPFTIAFFQEWLRYAEDPRILTDAPNTCGLPNYPGYAEHRHDQSILSLLGCKHQVQTVPDISEYGNDRRPPELPQIISLTRYNE